MTWPPSGSDPAAAPRPGPGAGSGPGWGSGHGAGGGAAAAEADRFRQLDPRVQRWIWQQNWTELRDAQARAIGPVLRGDDVIIAAATATGKTEAAFLPICSALLAQRDQDGRDPAGVAVLYVSPLKALINDQYGRLDAFCEHLDLPVHRWHGDVPGSRKSALLAEPGGILLITPESLEALLVTRGSQVPRVLGGLRYVVADELHSFLGEERGAQLQSLLHRAELAVRRRVPRIGLSATLGDMAAAAEFLRPGGGSAVTLVESADAQALRLQVLGFEAPLDVSVPDHETGPEAAEPGVTTPATAEPPADGLDMAREEVASHLYSVLRGTDNLVFANSRRDVEIYADLLRRRSDEHKVPCEFVPHHGSLSRELREDAEARLRDRSGPVTAVCTSTLELGIDIGTVSSIAQLGVPYTVSGLRQRLGRSGRRGEPATLRIYVTETETGPATAVPDALRTQLVQGIAMVNLLLSRWNEAPSGGGLHLSTLVQQVLSLIAQHGGARPAEAYRVLCGPGPFGQVSSAQFGSLLRALGASGVLIQAADGLLLTGPAGDRLLSHYSFYAAFRTAQEYRLVAGGVTIGSLPVDYPLLTGSLLIFGGRRWRVASVDSAARVIELNRAKGGRPPKFTGPSGAIADPIRAGMLAVYQASDLPRFLDGTAARLLGEGRATFTALGLDSRRLLESGDDTIIFPWRGDRVVATLAVALAASGTPVTQDGLCLTVAGTSPDEARQRLRALAARRPDPLDLAATVRTKVTEKHDDLLPPDLLDAAYAARSLDVDGAWAALPSLTA